MRRTAAAVFRKRGGNFGNPLFVQRHLHDHLAGELHPGRSEIEFHRRIFPEAAQAAMKISGRTLEQQAAYECQHRITQISMQRRHRLRLDATAKAITHYQVVTFTQLLDKRHQVDEVVGIVGVAHDDETATRGADTAHKCAIVTFGGNVDHPRAAFRREALRAISRTIVGDDYFAVDAVLFHKAAGFVDANFQGLGLVETRHDH